MKNKIHKWFWKLVFNIATALDLVLNNLKHYMLLLVSRSYFDKWLRENF